MREYLVLVLVILLYISLFMAYPCRAAPVWSDDFSEGNYSRWIVLNGTFSAIDHTLRSTGGGLIIHSSSITTGTWSFDILGMNDTTVGFISTYPIPLTAITCLGIRKIGDILVLDRATEGSGTRLRQYSFEHVPTGWQHIDITIDSDGRIYIYINGTLAMDYVYTEATTSEYFWVLFDAGGAIDNIVVSNTVDIQPPSLPFYMQTWFILSVSVVLVAAVIVVIFLMRRK